VNTLQVLITRLFRLDNPVDKRLIWLALGVAAVFGYLVFSGVNDGSGGATIAANAGGKASSAGAKSFGSAANVLQKPVIYVHVVGEVRHAGLYRLDSGSRVADAIFSADGFTARADQTSVNLARVLTDGEQLIVTRLNSAGGDAAGQNAYNLRAQSGGIGSTGATLVNLNRGDEAAIESLPGVGPTLAGRIIDWRAANGGFKSKADLQKVSGIGDKLFAKLKDLVVI